MIRDEDLDIFLGDCWLIGKVRRRLRDNSLHDPRGFRDVRHPLVEALARIGDHY